MSLISFMKEAGEKLFGKKVQETYAAPAKADSAALDAANREAATAIENHINTLGLTITALTVTFNGATGVAKEGRLRVGGWLDTPAGAQATIDVDGAGRVEVDPDSRLSLLSTKSGDYRLHLERGTLHAYIWAPPPSENLIGWNFQNSFFEPAAGCSHQPSFSNKSCRPSPFTSPTPIPCVNRW